MPFLRNCWYVAAWSSEVGDAPVAQKILGEDIVLYRDTEGAIVALGSTCPHRFAPLDRGKVVGDLLECPYHGLRFDRTGACALSQFDPGSPPPRASVPSYPVIERDRLIYIWMGERAKADPSRLPRFPELDDPEHFTTGVEGRLEQEIGWELVLDNLMDLSHVQFLHPDTLGTDSFTRGRTTDSQTEYGVQVLRDNPDGYAPTLFTAVGVVKPDDRVDTWGKSVWTAPGFYYLETGITVAGAPREEGVVLVSLHLLTPRDDTHTVYRYILFRSFALGNEQVSAGIDHVVRKAFVEEDEPMIREIQARMAGRDFWSLRPTILPTDRAGVLVRRKVQKLIREEQGGGESELGEDIDRRLEAV